jgi:membrane-bound lytic murein transglycosylase B
MRERPFDGDINGDGIIDITDLIALIENWLQSVGWVE